MTRNALLVNRLSGGEASGAPSAGAGSLAPVHHGGDDDLDLTIVTMTFDTDDVERLLPVLAKYVVLSRGHDGCRNIDLATSATRAGRFVIVEKWATPAAQRAHFDSTEMVEMAQASAPVLTRPPAIDLLDPITAHDLA